MKTVKSVFIQLICAYIVWWMMICCTLLIYGEHVTWICLKNRIEFWFGNILWNDRTLNIGFFHNNSITVFIIYLKNKILTNSSIFFCKNENKIPFEPYLFFYFNATKLFSVNFCAHVSLQMFSYSFTVMHQLYP